MNTTISVSKETHAAIKRAVGACRAEGEDVTMAEWVARAVEYCVEKENAQHPRGNLGSILRQAINRIEAEKEP